MEPPNWWVGMKNHEVQLLIYGDSISHFTPMIAYEGVTLKNHFSGDNPNYLFVNIEIAEDTRQGTIKVGLKNEKGSTISFDYEIKGRTKEAEDYIGFDSSDVVYLITPDRFANGNPSNDTIEGLLETEVDRTQNYKRHGGDIGGIIDHLDYIADMGFTALWSSPLLLNDMPEQSYHGYAITDFYKTDPRFGSLEEYTELSQKASGKGIKLIMDQVANHCGREHWWMKDLPFKDWVNYQDNFERGTPITTTNHRRTVNQDAYASEYDKNLMEKGWFVPSMPDLNQKNPFMAKYLIQNSIWWIETLQLGGIRQDTYPYPNKEFMANWAEAIMEEYPNFNIVGEEWSYNPLLVGYWQDGSKNSDGYHSNLKSTMDFPLQKALVEALVETEAWNKGLIKLYEGLSNDFYYAHPESILLFGDNHDMDRIFTQLNENKALTKMALTFILVAPRIPQIYYGTEILMENTANLGDHGLIRTDFPGGWNGDSKNGFTGKGLSKEQIDTQKDLKKLLNFRKSSSVLHHGQTKHFAPENGTYVLCRFDEKEKIVMILNKNEESYGLNLERFLELDIIGKQALNVLTDDTFEVSEILELPPEGVTVLHIKE